MGSPKRPLDVVFQPVMRSRSMQQADRILRAVAGKDVAIMLVGESGAGKEVFARRVHELSPRRTGPFVPINCAAIPEPLFESELFGHEKGAFTGATERVHGKIAAADGGTLLLDEIAEMPLAVQAKLLRFLENRKFMRVGGSTKVSVDTRLLCATLRPLEQDVGAGRFRADLYYRIQGITLKVPPLRERGADIPLLIQQFVQQMSSKHGTRPPKLTRAAMAALHAYPWPGNVRELRNLIELVCLLREGKPVRLADLPDALQHGTQPPVSAASECRQSTGALTISLDQPLRSIIDRVLGAALELEGGNRSRAARRLGISLRTVQRYGAKTPGNGTGLTAGTAAFWDSF